MTLIDPALLPSLDVGGRANKDAMAATLVAFDDAIGGLDDTPGPASAQSANWRGAGAETLITATVALADAAGQVTAVKTQTEWLASDLILSVGQLGYASDTEIFRVGDGVNVWANLEQLASGVSGSTMTVTRTKSAVLTTATTLTAALSTAHDSSGNLVADTVQRITGASGAVALTLSPLLIPGTSFWLDVLDTTNAVTLVLPAWAFDVQGDLTSGSAIVTNIADTSRIENGFGVSAETGITGGTTVLDADHGATSIQLSANATATQAGVVLTIDAGVQGTINGAVTTLTLAVGLYAVVVARNAFGLEVIAQRLTDNFDILPITSTTPTVDATWLGKQVELSNADPITVSFPTSFGAANGASFVAVQTGAGLVTFSGVGITTRKLASKSLAMAGQHAKAVVEYKTGDTWAFNGEFASA